MKHCLIILRVLLPLSIQAKNNASTEVTILRDRKNFVNVPLRDICQYPFKPVTKRPNGSPARRGAGQKGGRIKTLLEILGLSIKYDHFPRKLLVKTYGAEKFGLCCEEHSTAGLV